MRNQKYIIEVRNENGGLDFEKEREIMKIHPYLFSKQGFTIDELCYYCSFGQNRDLPVGPMNVGEVLNSFGVSFRVKYW